MLIPPPQHPVSTTTSPDSCHTSSSTTSPDTHHAFSTTTSLHCYNTFSTHSGVYQTITPRGRASITLPHAPLSHVKFQFRYYNNATYIVHVCILSKSNCNTESLSLHIAVDEHDIQLKVLEQKLSRTEVKLDLILEAMKRTKENQKQQPTTREHHQSASHSFVTKSTPCTTPAQTLGCMPTIFCD